MRNAKIFLTDENKMCFKPQGALYLFPIWNVSVLFLSKLLEGKAKYALLLKNSKRNAVAHNTHHLFVLNDQLTLTFKIC